MGTVVGNKVASRIPVGVSFQIITDKDAARPTVGAYAPYRAIGELKCPIFNSSMV
jgi:hypothetical protein